MENISTGKRSVSPLLLDESLPDLDQLSLNSFSITESKDGSIASDFEEEIAKVSEEGHFFERDCIDSLDDLVSDGIEVTFHKKIPHRVDNDNTYLQLINRSSGLYVSRANDVLASAQKGALYLFWLTFTKSFVTNIVLPATNCRLQSKGKLSVTQTELNAFLGIEIISSVLCVHRLRNMWARSNFKGNAGVKETMGRDRFYTIRRNIGLGMYERKNDLNPSYDPLWSTRPLNALF